MSAATPRFNAGAIRPIECWSAGWQLVKGQYWLLVGMTALGILVGSLAPMGILIGPAMCGIYLALLTLMRGERIEFGTLFKGFDYFLPSMIVMLIQMGIVFAVVGVGVSAFFVVLMLAAQGSGGEHGERAALGLMIAVGVFVLVMLAVSLAVGMAFLFTYPLIVERKLSGWEACKASAFAARANLGGALGLMVLGFLTGIAGVLLCYVGVFLVLPVQFAATAVAYRQVFPAPDVA